MCFLYYVRKIINKLALSSTIKKITGFSISLFDFYIIFNIKFYLARCLPKSNPKQKPQTFQMVLYCLFLVLMMRQALNHFFIDYIQNDVNLISFKQNQQIMLTINDESMIYLSNSNQILEFMRRLLYLISMTVQSAMFVIIAVLCLLGRANALNWQGTGTMTVANMTDIWSNIENNIQNYVSTQQTNLSKFATFLSNALNRLWDDAWNVFVIELSNPSLDGVVVGYAFRNHWMWFNNYGFAGRSFSFIIWKDYNCRKWNTIDNSMWQKTHSASDSNNSLYSALVNAIYGLTHPTNKFGAYPYDDLWNTLFLVADKLNSLSSKKAYSIVGVQNDYSTTIDSSSINGRFCSDGGSSSYIFTTISSLASATGRTTGVHKIIIMQMRSALAD